MDRAGDLLAEVFGHTLSPLGNETLLPVRGFEIALATAVILALHLIDGTLGGVCALSFRSHGPNVTFSPLSLKKFIFFVTLLRRLNEKMQRNGNSRQ